MGDLRDQLKKAKLLSKKDAKRLAHEERVHRSQVGREGLEREQAERRAAIEQQRSEQRQHTAEVQAELDAARRAAAERAACEDILAREVVQPHARGGRRWYFEVEDGSLPWLEIDEALHFQLQSGHYWVVRTGAPGSHVYGLLEAEQARRVFAAIPDVVVWAPGGVPQAG